MSVTTGKTGDRAEIPLDLAFELGQQEWVLGFTVGLGRRRAGARWPRMNEPIRIVQSRM